MGNRNQVNPMETNKSIPRLFRGPDAELPLMFEDEDQRKVS